MDARLTELLPKLAEAAGELQATTDWPEKQFRWLVEAGVLQWIIPQQYGGLEADALRITQGYQQLATACLVTTFVLTQRNGACQRIAGSDNETMREELLPPLARGDIFATVGISHLTTSRQHLKKPPVQVQRQGTDYVLNGFVPWVTGATQAAYVVTGGTLADNQQILIALPMDAAGVTIDDPVELLSLSASQTGSVRLDQVRLPERYCIAGPVTEVMKRGHGGGTGSLATSSLAVGLSERCLRMLEDEAVHRAELQQIAEPMRSELDTLRHDLFQAVGSADGDSEAIRRRANSLVLRASQAALTATKGAGFVSGHPAERAVREAMFFLVWSCPQPVQAAALHDFACAPI